MTRLCSDCAAPISRHGKTGRCRPCATARINADPDVARRRREGIRRRFADPAVMDRHIETAKRTLEQWRQSPGAAEAMRRQGQVMRAVAERPDVRTRWLAGREAAGRKRTETVLGWCPEQLRDEYRRLQRRMRAAEARKTVEAMMTPFERQMQAVRNGARLVEKFQAPAREYDFTLGGVSEI